MSLFERRKTANAVTRLKDVSSDVRLKTANAVTRVKDSGLDDTTPPLSPIVIGNCIGLLLALTYATES